jgi:hypothetical protein
MAIRAAFEAYLDMYSLTGNVTYLTAIQGAWEMFRDSFLHVGGAMALNEGSHGTHAANKQNSPGERL